MEMKFCQSCGMPLTDEILGTNADGSKNEDYCIYCYRDGKFLQECTMEEMIGHCAQFVDEVNKGLPQPITKEEYIGPAAAHHEGRIHRPDEDVFSASETLAQGVDTCGLHSGESRSLRSEGPDCPNGR